MYDFPGPGGLTVGQQVTGPGGQLYQWTGTGWTIAPASVAFAPLASPAFTGNPTAPTATAGDADTSIATTAFVQAAVAPGGASAMNFADNSGFSVNQRSYVSGTALAAGAFGHDRWKGGASGGTYTFAASGGPATTITITAGTLQQVVEGASLDGGTYVLSWSGTAQGRIGGGSYAASPVTAAVTAGTNTTIEFNAGTLGKVKLELGTLPTAWATQGVQRELGRCQRFYQTGTFAEVAYAGATGVTFGHRYLFPVVMRATPTLATSGTTATNVTGNAISAIDATAYSVSTNAAAVGGFIWNGNFTVSADL